MTDQLWQGLDREHLATVVAGGPPVVFASVTGAHLYGFASPDSDVDLRGAFVRPLNEVIGLRQPRETLTVMEKEPIDLDWVSYDIRKFASMMAKSDGNALEQLYSPLAVVTTLEHDVLCEIGRGCITRKLVGHYLGFGNGCIARLRKPNPTVKHVLYAYRVLLTGMCAMRTGEIVADIRELSEWCSFECIDGLVERKRRGTEKMPMDTGELQAHIAMACNLLDSLATVADSSNLPERIEQSTIDELNDFVIQLRIQQK